MERGNWYIPAPTMWYAAPDYVRLTCKVNDDNKAALYGVYEHVAGSVAGWLGENPRAARPWGFNGYQGKSIGPVSWGARDGDICLQVSGPGAEEVRRIDPPWTNIPRLDIQITLWYEEVLERIARDCARKSASEAKARKHRPWTVRHIDGYGKGDTTYIGSRQSAKFIRIYDKYQESGKKAEWYYAWRFEVEVKEGAGADYWLKGDNSLPGADYWAACVVRECKARGLSLPSCLPDTLCSPERVPRQETDNARRMRWLATQVASTVTHLLRSGVSPSEIGQALTGYSDAAMIWELYKSDARRARLKVGEIPEESSGKVAT